MATFEVELRDGRIVTVRARDENDAAQIVRERVLAGTLPEPETPAQARPSPLRPAGITTRGLFEGALQGVGTLGAIPLDIGYNVYAAMSSDADLGMPFTRGVTRTADRAADMMGLPQAASRGERRMQAVAEGAGSALATVGGAGFAAGAMQGISPMGARAAGALAQGPVTQTISGAAAGGVTQEALEMGADPISASLAGMAAGVGAAVPRGIATGAHELAKPWYPAGKRDIVGRLLRESATDPDAAMRRLDGAPQYVPGSHPTTGVASQDPGLIGLERGVERINPQAMGQFAVRRGANVAARNQYFDSVAPTEGQQQARAAARSDFADDATAQLFDGNPNPVDMEPVVASLGRVMNSRLGDNVAVRAVAEQARRELNRIVLTDTDTGRVFAEPGRLYAIRQNIARLIEGNDPRYTSMQLRDGSVVDATRAHKAITPLLRDIDAAIETAAPGYRAYMQRFRDLSVPIEQGNILQRVRERATSWGNTDPVSQQPFLNLASLRREVDSIRASADIKKLNTTQRAVLQRLIKDLDRETSALARSVRPPGSDTFQNLSTAGFIARLLGGDLSGALPRQLARPVQWLYSIPEQQLQDLLVQAMLDPRLASHLLGKPTKRNVWAVANELARMLSALQSSGRASVAVAAGWGE